MIILNEPKIFRYRYTCDCEARIQVEASDLDCYKVTKGSVEYVYLVECPVCGEAHSVPAGKIPRRMRKMLRDITDEQIRMAMAKHAN